MIFVLVIFALFIPTFAQAQVTYFANYEGTGTTTDPFRAHSNIRGTECKSLRANETQATGMALCIGPSLPVRAGIQEIDFDAPLTAQQKTFLANALGRPVTETTVAEALTALIDAKAVAMKRWKDGRHHLVLKGREFWSRSAPLSSYVPSVLHALNAAFHLPVLVPSYLLSTTVAWAAATLDEDWNCTDDPTTPFVCDHTWTLYQGVVAGIVSGTFRTVNSAALQIAYNGTALDSTDMLHRVTIASIDRGTATSVTGGAGVRHTGTSTSTYVFCVARDAASDAVEFGHVIAGAVTVDGTVSATVSAGDTIEAKAVGDRISCKHNGTVVLGPITENAGNGNVNVNVRMDGTGTATTTLVALDDSHAEIVSPRRATAPMVLP